MPGTLRLRIDAPSASTALFCLSSASGGDLQDAAWQPNKDPPLHFSALRRASGFASLPVRCVHLSLKHRRQCKATSWVPQSGFVAGTRVDASQCWPTAAPAAEHSPKEARRGSLLGSVLMARICQFSRQLLHLTLPLGSSLAHVSCSRLALKPHNGFCLRVKRGSNGMC